MSLMSAVGRVRRADRKHLNLPSLGRQHTFAEERTIIVTGRDSVPVAISICVGVSAHYLVAGAIAAFGAAPASVAIDANKTPTVTGGLALWWLRP
jgi:hypothetical protein